MKDYSVSEKIKFYSNLSRKGAIDKDGKPLSDFQRGVNFGKARMLSYCASKIKNSNKKQTSDYKLNMNTRRYAEEESKNPFTDLSVISSLFDD